MVNVGIAVKPITWFVSCWTAGLAFWSNGFIFRTWLNDRMASCSVLSLPVRVTILTFGFIEVNISLALINVRETSWSSHAFVVICITILTKSVVISCTEVNVCETSGWVSFFVEIWFTMITKGINIIKTVVNISETLMIVFSWMEFYFTLITNIVCLLLTVADKCVAMLLISWFQISIFTFQTFQSLLRSATRNCDIILNATLCISSGRMESSSTFFTNQVKIVNTVRDISIAV